MKQRVNILLPYKHTIYRKPQFGTVNLGANLFWWMANRTWFSQETKESAWFILQVHLTFFLILFVGRRLLGFSVFCFFLSHSIDACNYLHVTYAQIYSCSLFVFELFSTCRFCSFIHAATEFGRWLGIAMPLPVTLLSRTEPDLLKKWLRNYSEFRVVFLSFCCFVWPRR